MKEEKSLVDRDYQLFKTGGKGGWIFAEVPEISMHKTPFGMVKVESREC